MKKYILSILAGFLVLTTSCKNDFNDDVSDIKVLAGEADFSTYIALGNSLTSGYRDDALYITGQSESYPAMIAEQIALTGINSSFKIPYMSDELGGIPSANIPNKLVLAMVSGKLSPIQATGTATNTLTNIYQSQGPFQNMGIPGAKSYHLAALGYGNIANLASKQANPYFIRIASAPNASVLDDAVSQNPTFFSLWIGNNDVLGYATTGGDGSDPITPISTFQSAYKNLVEKLTANGAKGIMANLPNITDIPFFTTVPSRPFQAGGLSSQQIQSINAAYQGYNGGLEKALAGKVITAEEAAARKIIFVEGQINGAIIIDKDLTDLSSMGIPSYRLTTTKDLIILKASSVLSAGGGTSKPLADQLVLTAKEIEKIKNATLQYNTIIKQLAEQYNLAFADINALMNLLNQKSGIIYDGTTYTGKFVTGGAFSLDGVHPTGKGYAFIANEFIRAINKKYGSNLPIKNPNNYHGVTFP